MVQRSVVFDSVELLQVLKNTLVLVDRGGIGLLRILDQAYDAPNVTALELDLGETHFMNIRKLDKGLEVRLQAAWRKAVLHADMEEALPKVRICVVAVFS
jgi:hypothetical protein